MANLGFEKVTIGIMDDNEKVVNAIVLDKKKGGTINAKINGLAPETNKLFASNTAYYVSSKGSGDAKIDIEAAELTEEQRAAITGAQYEKGVLSVTSEDAAPYCSIILESSGLRNDKVFIALAKVKFSYDGDELKTNEGKGSDPNTDQLAGECISRSDGKVYAKGRTSNDDFLEADFFKDMLPGFEQVVPKMMSADVSSLELDKEDVEETTEAKAAGKNQTRTANNNTDGKVTKP